MSDELLAKLRKAVQEANFTPPVDGPRLSDEESQQQIEAIKATILYDNYETMLQRFAELDLSESFAADHCRAKQRELWPMMGDVHREIRGMPTGGPKSVSIWGIPLVYVETLDPPTREIHSQLNGPPKIVPLPESNL